MDYRRNNIFNFKNNFCFSIIYFLKGHTMKSIFASLLIIINDIGDIIFIINDLNLASKGVSKSISHLIWWF